MIKHHEHSWATFTRHQNCNVQFSQKFVSSASEKARLSAIVKKPGIRRAFLSGWADLEGTSPALIRERCQWRAWNSLSPGSKSLIMIHLNAGVWNERSIGGMGGMVLANSGDVEVEIFQPSAGIYGLTGVHLAWTLEIVVLQKVTPCTQEFLISKFQFRA